MSSLPDVIYGAPPEDAPAEQAALSAAIKADTPPCTQDPELWFADHIKQQRQAADTCNTICPIREACAAYAFAAGEVYGVMGGYTARQRARARNKQKQTNTEQAEQITDGSNEGVQETPTSRDRGGSSQQAA